MTRSWSILPWRPTLAGILLAAGGSAAAQDSIDNLSKQLIELRGEVEELNDELAGAKDQHRSRMNALARQRGEAEASLEQAQLQLDEVEGRMASAREDAEEAGADADQLEPVVMAIIEASESMVDSRLPFKRDERLAELDQIRSRVEQDVITPHKAINTLWAFYEDEIRLTGDNGLYQQTVRHDGEERLADVARLGMVMMFYRTSGGAYGNVVRDGDQWRYQPVDDSGRLVSELFQTFERQVRTGFFELPNAIGESGIRRASADTPTDIAQAESRGEK
ncbi:DUF3450 family protein [Spectribacter hydrogenooxidans]|uniref:DUF3450 family protein n=1 Tax=Spectribacter hydrogenoxidans TaxID=3075608 RepID=A0ABU3BYF1_9GAMM|nr:DUF3450 family protein [Salinisphaera sp. W335]MDT0634343.1 DUF3450 family protein [Salinisphaera sp. W335]